MKKTKLLTLIAVFILLAALVTVSVISASASTAVKAYTSGSHSPVEVTENNGVLGMHVYINGAFDGISFAMPTWSVSGQYSAYLSVYSWEGNYNDTMAVEPAATQLFEQLNDNATNKLTFDELPEGEYFVCIEKTTGHVGCWAMDGKATSLGYMMNDAVEAEKELELTVYFTDSVTEPFKAVDSVADSYGEAPEYKSVKEDQIDLSQYKLPADSLYLRNDVLPDTWVFTDGLGRRALTNADVGDPKEDKTVVIFYSSWHDSMSHSKVFNVQQFLDAEEAKGVDLSTIIYDYNYEGWPVGNYEHFWNEPIYGYYTTADPWVLRRQGELLANAGVDAISTDNTNGTYTWKTSYTAIYETWTKAQKDGVNTPKVSYMLPFGANADTNTQLESLYLDIYRDGKYQSLWFWLDHKPFMLAHPDALTNSGLHKEIKNFFTYRANYPGYINNNPGKKSWGWLSVYPQAVYYRSTSDKRNNLAEQITVGVAQNHNWKTHELSAQNNPYNTGRSYTSKGYDTQENSKLYGANFAEQWNYALEINPQVVYVTGWNEWIAGRYETWGGVTNAFPDQFNDENSRDIEPSRGDLKDHYYYQLVNNVRKYKGVQAITEANTAKTIDIKAGTAQWADVLPYNAAYIGNTDNRDYKGYSGYYYTDNSGRNDIIGTQMTRDNENIYILVECADNITGYTDKLWMNIYLDTDADSNGWESFDYVINKTTPKNESVAYLEKFTGNGYETTQVAEISYNVNGRYLQVAIKKADLGISGYDFTINYSITDNVHDEADKGEKQENATVLYTTFSGDILDFYTSGDVAPGGRFQYCYISTSKNAGFEEETTVEETTTEKAVEETTAEENTTVIATEPVAETTTVAEEATTKAEESKGGCKSSIAFAIPMVLTGAAAVIIRKKEN